MFESLPEDFKQIILKLPEEDREKAVGTIVTKFLSITTQTSFSGPLPHPQILKGYENVLAGSADRILKMAEKQSQHRQDLEKEIIPAQVKQSKRGQEFGLGIGVLGLLLGFALSILGHTVEAGILFTTTIIGLVSVFVIGKIYKSEGKDSSQTLPEG